MLKNLTIYQVKNASNITKEDLQAALSKISFIGCGSFDTHASGWISPRDNDSLVHEVNKQFLMMFVTEKKVLPSDTIKKATSDRAAELKEQQGFAPGRKALKDIKERVIEELLPRAFTTRKFTRVWLNATDGHLCIETSAPSKADEIIKCLMKTGANIELDTFRTKMDPQSAMTIWLESGQAPDGFTVDQDAELCSRNESKSTIKYIRQTLDHNDVAQHIAAGKMCAKLALTWRDSISFVLTKNLTINKLKLLDTITDQGESSLSEEERFDTDFTLFALATANMLHWLASALGGLQTEDQAAPTETPASDPEYDAAVAIVRETGRASISTVQRNLMIGYNRAARLIESMEKNGVVSIPDATGTRKVLPQTAQQVAAGGSMSTEKYMETAIALHKQGFIYAGLILGKNGEKDYHLFMHPEIPEKLMNWKEATEWARSINCTLPNRSEQFLLLANCKEQFYENRWYWSGHVGWYWSKNQEGPHYAWVQHFDHGIQRHNNTSAQLAVCAVRRVYPEEA